jgi:hypothetical protein
MITPEQILELAKTCECEAFAVIQERNDERDGVCYQFWEEQLIEFAQKIYEMGNENGWESREEAEYLNSRLWRVFNQMRGGDSQ